MMDALSQDQAAALNRDVSERIKLELGNLIQQVAMLQAQNAMLVREVERLAVLATESNHHARIGKD